MSNFKEDWKRACESGRIGEVLDEFGKKYEARIKDMKKEERGMGRRVTKEFYIKDLEGCEFHFLDFGIVICLDGKLIQGGIQVRWWSEDGNPMTGNLRNLPKCWAEACWLSHAIYEWPGIEKESLKEAGERLVRMYG